MDDLPEQVELLEKRVGNLEQLMDQEVEVLRKVLLVVDAVQLRWTLRPRGLHG